MTFGRQRLGQAAEALAAEWLGAAGLRVIERNARVRDPETGLAGELDLIAECPEAIVFVEVKAGRASRRTGPERPALAVGRRKQLQIRRLARAWLATRSDPPRFAAIRFDVVGVTYAGDGAELEWLPGAF